MHIHVYGERGEAKYWMEPQIELAQNHGLSDTDLNLVRNLIEEHDNEIRIAWKRHFNN